jgi:hypothetical protein
MLKLCVELVEDAISELLPSLDDLSSPVDRSRAPRTQLVELTAPPGPRVALC